MHWCLQCKLVVKLHISSYFWYNAMRRWMQDMFTGTIWNGNTSCAF